MAFLPSISRLYAVVPSARPSRMAVVSSSMQLRRVGVELGGQFSLREVLVKPQLHFLNLSDLNQPPRWVTHQEHFTKIIVEQKYIVLFERGPLAFGPE